MQELKFDTEVNFYIVILNFNFKKFDSNTFWSKSSTFYHAPSQIGNKGGLYFIFWFQNITYIFLGKVSKFQERFLFRFGVLLQKPQTGGAGFFIVSLFLIMATTQILYSTKIKILSLKTLINPSYTKGVKSTP